MVKEYLKKEDIIFLAITFAIVSFLIIRCFYGFGMAYADEFSQPAVVKRFFDGDRLLIDDWQPATTLIGYFIYFCISFLPDFNFTILELRLAYVVFQVIVATAFLIISGWDKTSARLCAWSYLCSTPYGIMSINYNTVAIGAFLLFSALFISEYKPVKVFIAGIMLSVAVLANPYLVIIFALYLLVTIAMWIIKSMNNFFNVNRLLWLCLGISTIFIPFCIVLMAKGNIHEYVTNIQFVFNDKEHVGDGVFTKLFSSQYIILRVYWRVWVPLLILTLIAFVARKRGDISRWIYGTMSLVVIYGTIRFAFIYGSISINLMVVPMFFLGLLTVMLLAVLGISLKNYYYEIVWLVTGYFFTICNYLATNTEILSMSAMFIVPVMASISICVKYVKNNRNGYFQALSIITMLTYIISLFVLRMTYVWGGSANAMYDVRIDDGIAQGIYTTAENAAEYNENLEMIRRADIASGDNFLCVPINALCYLETLGKISSPYVVRFETDLDELQIYYDTHPYKLPTKLLVIKDEGKYDSLLHYFEGNGYIHSVDTDKYCVLEKH